jgi:hypothetical protein
MINQDTEQTLVVFRKWKDTGDIIALFPHEEWNHAGDCASYMHVGQHGGAHYQGVIQATVRATEEEYAPLQRELERIGYNLKVRLRR